MTHRQAGRFGNGFLTAFGCLTAVVVFAGLCVVFVCGGGLTLLGLGSAGAAKLAQRGAEERQAREQALAEAPVETAGPSGAATKPTPTSGPGPAVPTATPGRPAVPDSQTEWDSPAQVGKVAVRVLSAATGRVEIVGGFVREARRTEEPYFAVSVSIANLSADKKLTYESWTGRDFAITKDYASLKDEHGNVYKRINFGVSSRPKGGVDRSDSIYPEKTLSDVLVFEPPVKTAKHLTLNLPCKNFGAVGEINFHIPTEAPARRPANPPPEPKPPEPETPPQPGTRNAAPAEADNPEKARPHARPQVEAEAG